MKRKITTAVILICFLLIHGNSFAQLGKNGAKIIASAVTNSNEYTTLTADAAAGNTFVSVSNSTLNSGGNFSSPLDTGDLIMIIQMQGATLNAAADSTWGAILNYNNCGNYEFAEVLSTPNSTTINLNCGLQNNYSASGRVQVIRVPRYSSLTVNSGGVVSCPAWNGATGGVLAIEVSGNTLINGTGKIDVSGKGFRGGQLYDNNASYGVWNYVWATSDYGKEKGEGIGGYEGDYDTYGGRYCKGAGANSGGGGNTHNGGGGGGGNGGNPTVWTGKGNPDISTPSWATAWNLEYAGFANSSSSGGGRGGYTFSGLNENPLVLGPDTSAWGGDHRDNNGGLGGRPLDYSTGRIFLGGGGGAGDQNDNAGGAGGAGGGLFYLVNYGTVNGSGQILSNGSNGLNTGFSGTDGGIDGAGGAGAGGTIIINSSGAITSISATANGGNGGNQSVTIFDANEAEGPGGGGGGGYIAISNGSITRTANGGNNGTTNSTPMRTFPANGSTKGGNGTNNATISNFTLTASNVTVCKSGSANLNVTVNGSLPLGTTIYWYDSPFGENVLGNGTSFTTSAITANATYYVGTCPGTYRLPVAITIDSVVSNFSFSNSCLGTPSVFNSSTSLSSGGTINQWSWNFGDGFGGSSLPNPAYQYASGGSFSVSLTVTDNAGCNATDTQTVNVGISPAINFDAVNNSGCDSLAVQFINATTNGQSYLWNFGDGDTSSQQSPLHNYKSAGVYSVRLSSIAPSGCSAVDTITDMIVVNKTPVANFSIVTDCGSRSVQLTDSSIGHVTSWAWNFGDTSGTSNQPDPLYIYNGYNTYTIKLVVSNGGKCSDSIAKTVTFNTPPEINFSATSVKGCDSLTVQFTNTTTNAVSYKWDFGDGHSSTDTNPTNFYANAGAYNVTLVAISPGGCSIAQSDINMITVDSTPAIPIINQEGDSLVSSVAANYQWYNQSSSINGATSRVYRPLANGDYFVVVTNAYGCSSTSSIVSVVLTGINKEVETSYATCYPNPVNDLLEVSFGNLTKTPTKAVITDVLGKVVWEGFITGSSKKLIIDMKELTKSVYFLTLYYSDKTSVFKIIKD